MKIQLFSFLRTMPAALSNFFTAFSFQLNNNVPPFKNHNNYKEATLIPFFFSRFLSLHILGAITYIFKSAFLSQQNKNMKEN